MVFVNEKKHSEKNGSGGGGADVYSWWPKGGSDGTDLGREGPYTRAAAEESLVRTGSRQDGTHLFIHQYVYLHHGKVDWSERKR